MPRPRICECAPILSILVTSLTSETLGAGVCSDILLNIFK